MPVLTFQLALILVSSFVVGSLATWLLQERRARRERAELEAQMKRALQTRYEVYEGLEGNVIKLLTRFEALEGEFKTRLELARNPRAALDKTVALRSRNPELWDIEREHHRVQAVQASEIARHSARIHELMSQLEALEPGVRKAEGELAALQGRHATAVANANEAETLAAARGARLQARVDELEPLASLLEASRRETERLGQAQRERDGAHATQVGTLEKRITTLEQAEARAAELQAKLAQREQGAAELEQRVAGLENDLAAARIGLEGLQARCATLDCERAAAATATRAAQATLEVTRSSQSALQAEYDACRAQLAELDARSANQKSSLADALGAADELRRELDELRASHARTQQERSQLERTLAGSQTEIAQYRAQLSHRSNHVEEAWSVLNELRPMLETLEQKLKDTDAPPAALPARSGPATFDLAVLDDASQATN